MELVQIMYEYINKFINNEKLVLRLNDIDLTKYSKTESNEIKKLIKEVKEFISNTPNELDEFEKKRLQNIEMHLESINKVINNKNNKKEDIEKFKKMKETLEENKLQKRDGGKLYYGLRDILSNNKLVVKYAKKMDLQELLNFITQYFQVMLPPAISQETFDELTNVAIKEDAREKLFRLAFNYEGLKKDFSKIEDYFIEKRDAYFLTELYSAVPDDIDIDNLLRKVIETKDRDFMFDVKNHAKKIGLSDDEWKRLIDLANKIYNELEDNSF